MELANLKITRLLLLCALQLFILSPHRSSHFPKQPGKTGPIEAAKLYKQGLALFNAGKYDEAEPLYLRALAIREEVRGADHPDVAESLNNLGLLYRTQGQYARAEPMFHRALAIREKAFGLEHDAVAQSLNSLAWLYYEQGRYAEAEPLYERALTIREKASWSRSSGCCRYPQRPRRTVCWPKGSTLKRSRFIIRSLAIYERIRGPEHPEWPQGSQISATFTAVKHSTRKPSRSISGHCPYGKKRLARIIPMCARTLNNLAWLYQQQGQYAKAESLYQRTLIIREKALGQSHPFVARTLDNLAGIYRRQGEYARAEALYQRALNIREKSPWPKSPCLPRVAQQSC